jgi:hypothetical protein
MISVQEVAESFAGTGASVWEVDTLRESIIESLVSLGVSPNAEWDFHGPRRKTACSLDDAAEQLVDRYTGGTPHMGECDVIKEGIERGLRKIGRS